MSKNKEEKEEPYTCPKCDSTMADPEECQHCEYNTHEMRRLKEGFLIKHLAEVGETYLQHAVIAITASIWLSLASVAQLVHAIFPFVHPPFGTDISSMINFLKHSDPIARNQHDKIK